MGYNLVAIGLTPKKTQEGAQFYFILGEGGGELWGFFGFLLFP
jgi:hypothetical protein